MKKPVKKPSRQAEIARIKRSLWRGSDITARELADGLQKLLDDDPGNLDAEFMFGLCRGCPEHAEIICKFTHPRMRQLFATSAYVQKQPQLRKAFIDGVNRIKRALPEEPKDKKPKLFRK